MGATLLKMHHRKSPRSKATQPELKKVKKQVDEEAREERRVCLERLLEPEIQQTIRDDVRAGMENLSQVKEVQQNTRNMEDDKKNISELMAALKNVQKHIQKGTVQRAMTSLADSVALTSELETIKEGSAAPILDMNPLAPVFSGAVEETKDVVGLYLMQNQSTANSLQRRLGPEFIQAVHDVSQMPDPTFLQKNPLNWGEFLTRNMKPGKTKHVQNSEALVQDVSDIQNAAVKAIVGSAVV